MRTILFLPPRRVRLIGPCVCLLLLCSCITRPTWPTWYGDTSIRPDLPPEVSFNKSAGRGENLFVTLRLESGEEMLFLVDTAGPATLMDKSLAPRLGKPLARAKFSFAQSGPRKGRVYRAPGLYLGNTRILTGKWVVTDDLSDVSFRRFLDPDQSENEELGKAFPLTFSQGSIFPFVSENLLGAKGGVR